MKIITLIIILFCISATPFKAHSQSNKLINSSVSVQADPGGLFVNTIAFALNSIFYNDDNNYNDYYYEEDENERIRGKKLMFGGEFKLNFNLHQQFTLSGGYRVLSIPNDYYGEHIISSGFYVEPHINLSNQLDQTPFVFGQFGKTSFSQKEIINHWQYTFGLGYKYEGTSLDIGYNLFNKPLEQEPEFYVSDNLIQTENSFLNKGFAMVRFTADLF